MTARSVLFIPFIGLTLIVAFFAFRLGWVVAHLTETDVIEARAAEYVAQAGVGARLSDCVAFPSEARGIWVIVRCGGVSEAALEVYEYHVNRFGGVEYNGAATGGVLGLRENDV